MYPAQIDERKIFGKYGGLNIRQSALTSLQRKAAVIVILGVHNFLRRRRAEARALTSAH
jgi:hypothetical protein